MRTILHVKVGILLMSTGCVAGEYTTTLDMALATPDLAQPKDKPKDMTSSPDMSTQWKVAIDGFRHCSCTPKLSETPVTCELIPVSDNVEQCDGDDDDCDGIIDNIMAPDPNATYSKTSLPHTSSRDTNCDKKIEYGIELSTESPVQRDLIVLPSISGACTQAELTAMCRKRTDMASCHQTAVACLGLSTNICGQANVTIYKCMYDSMLSPSCNSNVTAQSVTNQAILCR